MPRLDLDGAAVVAYRQLAEVLVAARQEAGLTLRQLAAETGHALSVLTALEQGSAWPRLHTVESVAAALGLRLLVGGREDCVATLKRRMREDEASVARLARDIGVRPNTLYELGQPGRSPSMATVLRLCVRLRLPVALDEVRRS